MKRILLTLAVVASVGLFSKAKAQLVFNELYYEPGSGHSEYFELYNSSASSESLDAYTVISYYISGSTTGFIVMNLPAIALPVGGFSTGVSAASVTYQGGSYTLKATDFNWSSIGSTGYIKNFVRNGNTSTYTEQAVSNFNDVLPAVGNGYITLLYKNGVLANSLFVQSTVNDIKSMPDLLVPGDGGVTSAFTAKFSTLTASQIETLGQGVGSDNGAHRTSDGKCGAWAKNNNSSDNTPGKTNGSSAAATSTIVVGGQVNCTVNSNGLRTATWFIVTSTPASAYPLVLQAYDDVGSVPNELDADDKILGEKTYTTQQTTSDPQTATVYSNNAKIIIVAKSTAGCFQTIQLGDNQCGALPVLFGSFNATRNKQSVAVKWETTTEVNNKGFYIQRQVGNDEWKNVAFVFSKSPDGNSSSLLTYTYNELNTAKGVSNYRIQQVDNDGRTKYSDVRSVRGEEMANKVVIFPNPSTDGKVTVVFDDANSQRDVIVSDMAGRVVKKYSSVNGSSLEVNLNDGFYTIQVIDRTTAAMSVEKVVIKKR